jgi:hypothetical protein
MASFTSNRLQQTVAQDRKALAAARPAVPASLVKASGIAAPAVATAANVVSPVPIDQASPWHQ